MTTPFEKKPMTREEFVAFLKTTTVDELVTQVKLAKAGGAVMHGTTTPEGVPFCVAIALGPASIEMQQRILEEARVRTWVNKTNAEDYPPEGEPQ